MPRAWPVPRVPLSRVGGPTVEGAERTAQTLDRRQTTRDALCLVDCLHSPRHSLAPSCHQSPLSRRASSDKGGWMTSAPCQRRVLVLGLRQGPPGAPLHQKIETQHFALLAGDGNRIGASKAMAVTLPWRAARVNAPSWSMMVGRDLRRMARHDGNGRTPTESDL